MPLDNNYFDVYFGEVTPEKGTAPGQLFLNTTTHDTYVTDDSNVLRSTTENAEYRARYNTLKDLASIGLFNSNLFNDPKESNNNCVFFASTKTCPEEFVFVATIPPEQKNYINFVVVPHNAMWIKSQTFSDMENLTGIILPPSVYLIENKAFENCINLKQIIIPNRLINIPSNIFLNCRSLSRITIPKSVVSFNDGAFFIGDDRPSNAVVTYEGTLNNWIQDVTFEVEDTLTSNPLSISSNSSTLICSDFDSSTSEVNIYNATHMNAYSLVNCKLNPIININVGSEFKLNTSVFYGIDTGTNTVTFNFHMSRIDSKLKLMGNSLALFESENSPIHTMYVNFIAPDDEASVIDINIDYGEPVKDENNENKQILFFDPYDFDEETIGDSRKLIINFVYGKDNTDEYNDHMEAHFAALKKKLEDDLGGLLPSKNITIKLVKSLKDPLN